MIIVAVSGAPAPICDTFGVVNLGAQEARLRKFLDFETYLHATMDKRRTSALALLSIESDFADNQYDDPDEFAKRGDRRLAFGL